MLIDRIKEEIRKHSFQIVGTVLLVIAFVLAFQNYIIGAWAILLLVGILDLIIIRVYKDITISRWIRGLTGPRLDNVIMFGLVILCFWLKGEVIALWFLFGLLNCHFFERD